MHILTWKEKHGAAPGVVSPSACLLVDVFFCFNHKLQVGVPAGFDGSIGPAEAANAHQFFLPTFIRSPKNNMTSMDSEPLDVNLHEFHHMFLQQTPIFLTKKTHPCILTNFIYLHFQPIASSKGEPSWLPIPSIQGTPWSETWDFHGENKRNLWGHNCWCKQSCRIPPVEGGW